MRKKGAAADVGTAGESHTVYPAIFLSSACATSLQHTTLSPVKIVVRKNNTLHCIQRRGKEDETTLDDKKGREKGSRKFFTGEYSHLYVHVLLYVTHVLLLLVGNKVFH